MRNVYKNTRGVTLMELLVVLGIIGVLVMIGIPNFYQIMVGHRLRSSANDLLTKTRWIRTIAIAKRRQLDMTINETARTLTVNKPAHTEYDMLKDIAAAMLAAADPDNPDLSSFVLFEEGSQDLGTFKIGDADKPGYDVMATTCPSETLSFNPSGTLSVTCNISITSSDTGATFTLKLYKGGQITLQ